MPVLILVFVVLGGAGWLLLWADPRTLARVLRGMAIGVLLVLGLFVAVRGLAVLDLPLGGLILYLLHHWSARGFPGIARLRAWVAGRPRPPGQSEIETGMLRMTLDQASGALSGTVLGGAFAGAPLDRLSLVQLRALLAECQAADAQSVRLLETYLDRVHPGWRDAEADGAAMTREEALLVLGLPRDAGAAQVSEAHRRLMRKLHPDLGGSDYLASKINAARDVLMETE